jgi:hypothetical protein
MSRLEIALLDLEKAFAYTGWVMRHQRMTPREAAIYHNGLAIASRSAEAQHRMEAERERHERIETWRKQG